MNSTVVTYLIGTSVVGWLLLTILRRVLSLLVKAPVQSPLSFYLDILDRFVMFTRAYSSKSRKSRFTRRPRLPSISQGLVGLAERRLPKSLSVIEKQRWGEEMRGDVASLPRRKRLWTAFNIWRKGAPKIPVGAEGTARSAGD